MFLRAMGRVRERVDRRFKSPRRITPNRGRGRESVVSMPSAWYALQCPVIPRYTIAPPPSARADPVSPPRSGREGPARLPPSPKPGALGLAHVHPMAMLHVGRPDRSAGRVGSVDVVSWLMVSLLATGLSQGNVMTLDRSFERTSSTCFCKSLANRLTLSRGTRESALQRGETQEA